jgi:hypothetical protein
MNSEKSKSRSTVGAQRDVRIFISRATKNFVEKLKFMHRYIFYGRRRSEHTYYGLCTVYCRLNIWEVINDFTLKEEHITL